MSYAYDNRAVIASAMYPACRTQVRVCPEVRLDDGCIALCVDTGASTLQTYATRDELRALGEMLLRYANENEVMEVAA
jgi:hypothetical protein